MPNVTIPPASRRHVPVDDASATRRGSADAGPKDMRQAEILTLQTYLRKLFGTDHNRAFRAGFGTKDGVGPVSPRRADVLRRHLERR
jgi:hypothetical protein